MGRDYWHLSGIDDGCLTDCCFLSKQCEGAGAPGNGENFVYLNAVSRSAEGLKKADKIEVLEERKHTLYYGDLYAHDLMLVKLKRDAEKDPLPYITLNLEGLSRPKEDDELSVLGFGDIDKDEDSIIIPDSLQHVTVNAVDFKYCWTLYEAGALALREQGIQAQDLTQDQMCAEAKGAGTCAGDSGGP
jgi:secreted trypsin-like serine protease